MKILGLVGLSLVAMAVNVHAYDDTCTTANNCVSIVASTPEERAADSRRRAEEHARNAEERARKEAEIRSVGLPPQRRAEAEGLLALQRAAAMARGEKTLPSAPSKPGTMASIPTAPLRDCKWNPQRDSRIQSAKTEGHARVKLAAMRVPSCRYGSPSEVTPVSCTKLVGLDAIDSKGRRIHGTAEVSFVCQYGWVCAQGFETCVGASSAIQQ